MSLENGVPEPGDSPGFKVGDRVRYTGKSRAYSSPSAIGHTGTVERGSYTPGVTVRVNWDHIPGRPKPFQRTIYLENLELVEPPYVPRVGDKVRVTSVVEAVVTATRADGGFDTEGPHYWDQRPDNETRTVELLEKAPEPFAVGTVVDSYGQVAFRTETGWVWDTGETSMFEDDWFRDPRVKILHEPPTS